MIYIFSAIVILLLVALLSVVVARKAESSSGLPAGQLIYSDTGHPTGRVASLITNEQGVKQERPLVSARYGLTGRPDYLVRTSDGVVPVEAKSTRCPPNGRAYASHVMQLAAYCLLVEDSLGASVPYGIIRYADEEVLVEYSTRLRDELIALLEEMKGARLARDVHRSHRDARRCARCSMREICEEALA
ncbi:MAG: CRISPR-associated protein Cas4 [Acidobacteriota bacterium]|nr:CRISPR-associated protein Cas4 [Acidobacteriota bacterium]